jgi:hypothetical protein
MTVINRSELAKLKTLDQQILWAVVSLVRSNTDPNNIFISDNAAIRQDEARDLVNYKIEPDDQGRLFFAFTALMPTQVKQPLLSGIDITETIKTYSGWALNSQSVAEPDGNHGFPAVGLPAYVMCLEQALFYWVRIAEAIGRMIRYANRSTTTGEVSIDFTDISPVLNGVTEIAKDTTGSIAGEVLQFEYNAPIYQGFSDYIKDIFDSLIPTGNGGIPSEASIDTSGGYSPKAIETLPVCKEHDPAVTDFTDNLGTILSKK